MIQYEQYQQCQENASDKNRQCGAAYLRQGQAETMLDRQASKCKCFHSIAFSLQLLSGIAWNTSYGSFELQTVLVESVRNTSGKGPKAIEVAVQLGFICLLKHFAGAQPGAFGPSDKDYLEQKLVANTLLLFFLL